MNPTEYIRRVRAGETISKDEVPVAHVHVNAAEGFLAEIDGLDARPPRLTRKDMAVLLGHSSGNGESRRLR
jgi:hypothetical protein